MGLGLLISGLIFGDAAISAGIDNAKMMSEPYRYLEDGTPVYLDRKCKEHINGEKVISKAVHDSHGNIKLVSVGQRSGIVYFDPEEAQRRRMDGWWRCSPHRYNSCSTSFRSFLRRSVEGSREHFAQE